MTEPRFVDCQCGHPKLSHELDLAPQCIADKCTCLRYQPRAAAPTRPVVTPIVGIGTNAAPATLDALLQEGKKSSNKNIVKLADRIAAQLHDLRGRLHDARNAERAKRESDAEKEAARREVAALEAKLAEAKAKLRGKPATASVRPLAPAGDLTCPECGKSGLKNLGPHRAKAHGYRREAS